MPVGYSVLTLKKNAAADARHPGVQLGKLCIEADVSVTEVAERLQVSRQTVYNWFLGVKEPHENIVGKISAYMNELREPVS